jgi:hypothetical protein
LEDPFVTLVVSHVVENGWLGETAFDATEAAEVPYVLVAVAVKVYGVAFVKPVIKHDVSGTTTWHVPGPGLAVTS